MVGTGGGGIWAPSFYVQEKVHNGGAPLPLLQWIAHLLFMDSFVAIGSIRHSGYQVIHPP